MKRSLFAVTLLTAAALYAETKVEFYSANIVRVAKTQDDVSSIAPKPFPTVAMTPKAVEVETHQSADCIEYTTKSLRVKVSLADGTVRFEKPDGTLLVEEAAPAKWFERTWNGTHDVGAEQTWRIGKDEAIYGLGDNQTRYQDMRGWQGVLSPHNVGDGVPVWSSIKGYAVYWDNVSPVNASTKDGIVRFESQIGRDVDYYFMYGGNLDGTVAAIRELTGDVPMFPRWAYGFWQSKERYKTQEETVGVVQKYRELGIPLDGIVQDWQYWGCNCLWNAMDFLSPDFRNPKWMIGEVHKMNAKMIITIWQSFGPQTLQYRELKEKNLLFPFKTWPDSSVVNLWPPPRETYPSGVRLYDAYSSEARDIYWKHLTRLFDLGIDGWWMDSTDPDHRYTEGDFEHPTSLGVTFRAVRSAFPTACVKGVYEHMRDVTDKRVFILTRGAGLGQQRYASSVWSGDIASNWDVLRKQIPGGLNYTLTGNPNFNCDLGGFFSGRYKKKGGGVDNPNWRELLVRWIQLGSFLPMMRNHGVDLPHEFYHYGAKGETAYDALVAAVKLRYRLMPYIYSLAADCSLRRGSFMRPLAADFPQDKNVWNLPGEFMMGKAILVTPVLKANYTNEDNKPVGELEGWDAAKDASGDGDASKVNVNWLAKRNHEVYLPDGADWWDFWTNANTPEGQVYLARSISSRSRSMCGQVQYFRSALMCSITAKSPGTILKCASTRARTAPSLFTRMISRPTHMSAANFLKSISSGMIRSAS